MSKNPSTNDESNQEEHRYKENEEVVYQQSPGHAVDEEDLDEDGMLRHSGTIVETPGYDGEFAGKKVHYGKHYKIQQKPGVYGVVIEERIVGRVGEVQGGDY